MTENRFCLTEEYEGERIDKVLVRLLEDTSRNYLKKLFADGSVQLNGKAVKPSARVKEGDEVWISIPDRVVPDILAEDIPLEVLYEDEDVLVVNKPKDMVVHPAAGHYSGTLVNAVMYRCRDQLSGINGVLRPGIVHRIDKDTTGSIIVCKNDAAHNSIAAQLKDHTIVRKDYAIVYGCLKERQTGRDPYPGPGAFPQLHICGMPPGDRQDPPDPGPYGIHRTSPAGRRGLSGQPEMSFPDTGPVPARRYSRLFPSPHRGLYRDQRPASGLFHRHPEYTAIHRCLYKLHKLIGNRLIISDNFAIIRHIKAGRIA